MWSGPFGVREAERLLWRAGFGPSPGHAQALADLGLHRAVAALTRPDGDEGFTGAEPTDADGGPIYPLDAFGHDHLWFLDRMVRTNQPLAQRMTLIWHDWFATSDAGVGQQSLLVRQNELFRRHWLGSFDQLIRDVTIDPAMILWLDANENRRDHPNENYARELMELFTLGPDRGAYTEQDVRELARALTGWRALLHEGARLAHVRLPPSLVRRRPARRSSARRATSAGSRQWRCACATRCTPPSS